MREKHKT